MTTTAERLLAHLEQIPGIDIKEEKPGRYRMNNPLRPGSNSHAFTLVVEDRDGKRGEHGAFKDYNPQGGPESGSLYELAELLNVEITKPDSKPAKQKPTAHGSLAAYAAAHGVEPAVFEAAGWQQTTQHNRPALLIPTATGPRYRFLDGKQPKYWHQKGYRRAWYGLTRALAVATNDNPLIICNGEASTVVAQHYGLAAVAITSGSEKPNIPDTLLAEIADYGGQIIVALDCDQAGRSAAPKLANFLKEHNHNARAVNLDIGNEGQDLADFCKLHGQAALVALLKCPEILPAEPANKRAHELKTIEFINALNALGYKFRMNELNDDIEVNGELITDTVEAEIRVRMWDAGYTKHKQLMADAYVMHAARNRYHPVKHYLEHLTYDGNAYIDAVAMHFVDQHNIFSVWFKKWIVGAVAKVYTQYQNPMLVLDGAQGRGKSFFAEWLCPETLHKNFVTGAIQPENNDHKIFLADKFLWEVSELGSTTRKSDREALKAFITTQWVTARKPYGKRPIHKPALASFIGTVNDEAGFLNDPTGSRRFMSCTLLEIDWGYSQLNVDNVWAEAYHLYKTGFNYRLTAAEKQQQEEINEHYEIEDPWGTEIIKHYEFTGDDSDFVAGADILTTIGKDHLDTRNTMRLARVMKKLRIQKTKRQQADGTRPNGFMGLKSRAVKLEI